jgi:hypothetical protein
MSSHACFWIEPTDEVEIHLRRYSGSASSKCCAASGFGYHNVSLPVERGSKFSYPTVHGDVWNHTDPRWPWACSCGYVFQESDHWQFNPETLYRRGDTGELVTQDAAPAGALMNAWWLKDWSFYTVGADGIILSVKLPDRSWWCPDGPAFPNGEAVPSAWQRTGAVPKVTVTPSILVGGGGSPTSYHGFLTDGVLVSCSDSPC